MISKRQKWLLVAFNAVYVSGFALYFLSIRNYEFLLYVAVIVFFFALVLLTIKRSKLPAFVLWGLSLWGLLHMAGGGVRIGDHVLYAQHLVPIAGEGEAFILKYDQVVHAFGFMVATLVAFYLLRPHLSARANWKVIYPVVAAAGMGLGALNEIVEFVPVAMGYRTGVGGYFNNALDLVFNGIGALVAVAIIHLARRCDFSSRA
jgi:uncharacterized membrane protein YjdF